MGWGGSVSAMIKTLRSNESLLKNKKLFTILKEEQESSKNSNPLKGKKIKITPISEELRLKIRAQSRKRTKRERRITIGVITSFIVLVMILYKYINS